MRLQHILALALLQVVPILVVQAQVSNESSASNLTTAENVTDIGTSEISTLADECGSWIGTLLASDLDASNGLSESEFHKFLSSIEEPPYIAEYFRDITSFNQLAWVFRAVYKSLACHCQRIGMGAGCCTGADAEVLLSGLGVSRKTFDITTTESVDEEYVAFFCQQIEYVLTASIFSPTPTSPMLGSSAPSQAGEPIDSQSVSLTPSVHAPVEPVSEVIFAEGASEQEQDNGLGTGEIVGIAIAVFLAFTFVIALVSYRHKSLERARLSKPLESNILDADIESTPAIALDLEVTPDCEQTADDNCLAPRVVSEITPFADDEIEADSELHTLSIFESVSSQLELDPSHLESIPSQLELVLSQVESVPSHLELGTDSEIEEEEEEVVEEESYASSVWSESDAGESGINYNNCASTLAALGAASTVTAKLMANSCSENA